MIHSKSAKKKKKKSLLSVPGSLKINCIFFVLFLQRTEGLKHYVIISGGFLKCISIWSGTWITKPIFLVGGGVSSSEIIYLFVVRAFWTFVATSSRKLDDGRKRSPPPLLTLIGQTHVFSRFYNFYAFNAPKCRIHRRGGVGEVGSLDPSRSVAKPRFSSNQQPKGSVPAVWVPLALKV